MEFIMKKILLLLLLAIKVYSQSDTSGVWWVDGEDTSGVWFVPSDDYTPSITSNPENVTEINLSGNATFGIVADGDSLRYRWYRNGTALSNSNDDTISVSITFANEGYYRCAVWSIAGNSDTVYSSSALLRVKPRAPVITVHANNDTTTSKTNIAAIWTGDSVKYAWWWYRKTGLVFTVDSIFAEQITYLNNGDSIKPVVWNSTDTISDSPSYITVVYAIFDSINTTDSNRIYLHGNFLSGDGWNATLNDTSLTIITHNSTNLILENSKKLNLIKKNYKLILTDNNYIIKLNIGFKRNSIFNIIGNRTRIGFRK